MASDLRPPSPMSGVICARCGVGFDCSPSGDCWCAAESVRLPMPEPGATSGCLCPSCLRAAALGHQTATGEH